MHCFKYIALVRLWILLDRVSVAVSAVGKIIAGIALVADTCCSTDSDSEEARNVQMVSSGMWRCVAKLTEWWRNLKNATAESPRVLVPNYMASHPWIQKFLWYFILTFQEKMVTMCKTKNIIKNICTLFWDDSSPFCFQLQISFSKSVTHNV